ncbi:MAG: hypothetical protein M3488_08275 [Actinomycetota bacterium]|nr:hypothetical protein [Actinomycetota bacterium]
MRHWRSHGDRQRRVATDHPVAVAVAVTVGGDSSTVGAKQVPEGFFNTLSHPRHVNRPG